MNHDTDYIQFEKYIKTLKTRYNELLNNNLAYYSCIKYILKCKNIPDDIHNIIISHIESNIILCKFEELNDLNIDLKIKIIQKITNTYMSSLQIKQCLCKISDQIEKIPYHIDKKMYPIEKVMYQIDKIQREINFTNNLIDYRPLGGNLGMGAIYGVGRFDWIINL